MKKLLLFLFSAVAVFAQEQEFRFIHRVGEKIRFLGIVNQRVWFLPSLDPRKSLLEAALSSRFPWVMVQNIQMLNRIQQETLEVDQNGRGRLRGNFQITQQKIVDGESQPIFYLAEEYQSEFWRDTRGRYEISSAMVMPVVRGVPTFPERPVDEWIETGEEYHDLSREFGLTTPLRVPVRVRYRRTPRALFQGQEYDTFQAEYSFEVPTIIRPIASRLGQSFPTTFAGKTVMRIFWDSKKGRQVYYEEDYVLALRLSNGQVFRFEGDSSAQILEAPPMDREREAQRIRETLRETGQPDIEVVPNERGVTIQLPDQFIRFGPDSAVLLPSEQRKLDQIAEILRRYPDRDLLIEGHTALAGTEAGRQRLSEERARAVASYLIQRGVRTPERLTYRGWGANRPLAPNDTPENRARNRRVEITILEN